MHAKEAAEKLRPDFHLELAPPEERHHIKFVEDVAAELGVEPTPSNLHQVGLALDRAGIEPDSNEYPKMLYSRTHHAEEGISASTYDKRHDLVWAHVGSEDEAKKLGPDWVENIADLPLRAPVKAPKPHASEEHHDDAEDQAPVSIDQT